MRFLFLKAYWKLIYFGLLMGRGNFKNLYEAIRLWPVRARAACQGDIETLCSAIDMACIWYRKEVRCLQRSAATACLLRDFGVSAQMVIGTQVMPNRTHAWVEVDGKVVNDKPYMAEKYIVMDRC